jgi:CDP-diacylglycerol--serine O-phosphatidyltransferase
MVSSIRFTSFKDLDLRSKKPVNSVIVVILLICVFASEPQIMLFAIGLIYLFSGPAGYVFNLTRKKRVKKKEVIQAGDSDG